MRIYISIHFSSSDLKCGSAQAQLLLPAKATTPCDTRLGLQPDRIQGNGCRMGDKYIGVGTDATRRSIVDLNIFYHSSIGYKVVVISASMEAAIPNLMFAHILNILDSKMLRITGGIRFWARVSNCHYCSPIPQLSHYLGF